eukprot:UN26120
MKTRNQHLEFSVPGDKKIQVNCAILHPNQVEVIAGYSDGYFRVWDLSQNGKCKVEISPEQKNVAIRSMSIAQDASRFICSNDRGSMFNYDANAKPENIEEENNTWELQRTGKV